MKNRDRITLFTLENAQQFQAVFPPDLLESYRALEERVRKEISRRGGPVCSVCDDHCCKGIYCSETPKSPWLYAVASLQGPVNPPQGFARLRSKESAWALCQNGCSFAVGRSKRCSEYTCEKMSATFGDEITLFAYLCLSSLLIWVSRNFCGKISLDDLIQLDAFTPERFQKLRERLEEGWRLADDAMAFLSSRNDAWPMDSEAMMRLWRLVGRFPELIKQARTSPLRAPRPKLVEETTLAVVGLSARR